ncbi:MULTISPECIES: ACP S-malonyltransferase [Kitasatospora]|uniref:[acyl-carrier-protein] S-malonyltransferase n=1 Tax=Kitasatospora setae (strain ATCC 33774 / DSM 43861 / JCM 3304 / KCC A-0304 / NBRC 14216 / KM-6054) TaxID=452652 RepID=E4NAT0_KITSK|nr:ACP S-malonyltransferase [Kitasatospora setae]BAJ28311.1 putative malonyl-CoA--acyl carrier protein transacylase [Kitasatospora setae KM-6054]
MLVIVAPGQGAQTPGFLNPWLELDGAADRLRQWSETAGLDLLHAGTGASEEEIKDTAVAQPLLVAAGLVTAAALFPQGLTGTVGAVAGHSVGEITAAALAGVLSEQDALNFVRERSLGMAEAAAATATGMTAVLGGDQEAVLAKLAEHGVTAANNNGGGQLVAAGTLEQLAALKADPPAGARLIPLKVAGAFHTAHMGPGVVRLEKLAPTLAVADPALTYLSNRDGEPVGSGAEVLARLVSQVSNPVRWDLCMETLQRIGATAVIELSPAGTLTNLVKRNVKGVATLALKTPADLDKARALVAEHGSQEATA